MPDVDDHGIHITSGFSTLVGINGKEAMRLSWPHGTCSTTDEELGRLRQTVAETLAQTLPHPEADTHTKYAQQDCYSSCLQRLVWRTCRCLDSTLKLPFPNLGKATDIKLTGSHISLEPFFRSRGDGRIIKKNYKSHFIF